MTKAARPPIEAWEISAELTALPGGARNTVLRTIGLEKDFVFKSTRRSEESILWLLSVQTEARQSGCVVPELQRMKTGTYIAGGWTCEPFVEGTQLTTGELRDIEPILSRFHRRTARYHQRPEFRSSRDLLTCDRGGDVKFDGMPPDVVRTCRSAWKNLQNLNVSVVHGDVNAQNTLRTPDGRVVLLDWDECRRDYSIFDIGQFTPQPIPVKRALMAWEVACSWWIEPAYAREMLQELA